MTKWYWYANDTGDGAKDSAEEVLEYYSYGNVHELLVAEPKAVYAASLAPAPDDPYELDWFCETNTYEECQAAIDDELNYRAWCLSWGGI